MTHQPARRRRTRRGRREPRFVPGTNKVVDDLDAALVLVRDPLGY
ncbi:hypothetical protein ACFQH8_03390 [Halomicroarcula sp. GCM10025710]